MRDRLSFVRFPGSSPGQALGWRLEDKVPDAKTAWLYREELSQAGVIEALFNDFDGCLNSQGYEAMGGQIIEASIVAVPVQRGSRDENEQIKRGETPEAWVDERRPSVGKRACPRLDRGTRMRAGRRKTAGATMATRTTSPLTVGTS